MHCFSCGTDIGSLNKYCPNCGLQQTKTKTATNKRELKSFDDFIKSSKYKKKTKLDENTKSVTIHVGMLHKVKGCYRQLNGSRTPVFLEMDSNYDTVKKAAFDKLKRYVPEMIEYDNCDLELTYRSGQCALFLPGTLDEFTLKKYRADLGCKPMSFFR